jgi:tRNA threonylcarbamoyladenosine biosynthesis protein TsaB
LNILALDTATDVASVAVLRDDMVLHEESFNYNKRHSQIVVPMIKHILEWVDMAIADIDLWAVDIGPGSFTGLRIGCATIKALAHVTAKPIAAVTSLDILAEGAALPDHPVYPLIDAQQQNVYTARYIWSNGHMHRQSDYMIIHISQLKKLLIDEAPVVFTGPAVSVYHDDLKRDFQDDAILMPDYRCVPVASMAGILGEHIAQAGDLKNYITLLPFYMRKSQAEIRAGV